MRDYHLSESFVRTGMTGMKGWVLYNWSIENESRVWGNSIRRSSKGYIAQEIEKLNGRRKNSG